MPIYSYQCSTHGEFCQLKAVSLRNDATYCPDCNELATRSVTTPNLTVMSDLNRQAWQRNEKSMHEPKRVTRKHKCSHDHAKSAAHTHIPLKVGQKNSRPWMLGH